MKVLLLSSHAILEYDELRLLSDLGYDVFCPGGYSDPRHPSEAPATKAAGMGPLRPALDLPYHADLDRLCTIQREKHDEGNDWAIDWAKADLHSDLIDWADVIVCNMFPERWIAGQWKRIKHKRVVWRTVGQSGPDLEDLMAHYARFGLQIIRCSPKEQIAFERMGHFAGQDALIRFAKYPADWYGWTGEDRVVGNLTQSMKDRGAFTGYPFWRDATQELPVKPAGGGSEELPGGLGLLSYEQMRAYLRSIRVMLYTGTQPASYTLGLIEAMMTGTPVISIGPSAMWVPDLFEGHEIAIWSQDRPQQTAIDLERLLNDEEDAAQLSQLGRARAIELFGVETVAPQWLEFLGAPVRQLEGVA